MTWLRQDLRYAIRTLRCTPGFSLAAIVTLGLGIGATTAIFTIVNGVLLRPLPYAESGRLANIWNDLGKGAQSAPAVSPDDFRDYQRRSRTFEEFAAAAGSALARLQGNLTGSGEPERVQLSAVTANFFSFLGVRPALGRNFLPEEEVANGPHVALIGHDLWRRRYGGDPTLVGRSIQIDGVAYTVVGVLPQGFHLLLPAEAVQVTDSELWVPLQWDYARSLPRNYTLFTVFGRLEPATTFEQAQAEMNIIAEELRKEFPEHATSGMNIRVVPLHDDIVKHARPALALLLAAVGLVLLIACANVAHLLLVRATARQGEFALRAALGAGPWPMARQLLTESLLLALSGGALGLVLSLLALELLRVLRPANLPRLAEIGVDASVFGFTMLTCLLTAAAFGAVPALLASRAEPHGTLQSAGRAGTGGHRNRSRAFLIMVEVALSVLLLIGAGLLVRSFAALQRVEPGYDPSDVLTFQLALPTQRYPQVADRLGFLKELEARLAALPGVRSVGGVSQLPLTGGGNLSPFAYDEETARNWESVTADDRAVFAEYFQTIDARLIEGRYFTEQDGGGPPVLIVDERLAQLAWPGQSALGKQLQTIGPGGQVGKFEVVGVVGHMRSQDLTRAVRPQIFRPMGQQGARNIAITVESSVRPSSLGPAVVRTVAQLDKDLPVTRLLPMSTYLTGARAQARFSLILMGTLGVIALLLTAVGIFGVISYSISQRTREFGIRLALGEDPRHTRRTVVLGGMRLVLVSIGIGVAAALALTRLVEGLLYEVSPADPLTFTGISVLLAGVALLACYFPARRATRVDPVIALRSN